MSIERALHERWRSDATLCALLPGARLFTGIAPSDPPPPYATLTRLDTRPVLRTSSGTSLDEARIELSLWAAELETLQQIAAAIERRFERSSFATSEGDVLLMHRANRQEHREPSGLWRATLTYLILHETPLALAGGPTITA